MSNMVAQHLKVLKAIHVCIYSSRLFVWFSISAEVKTNPINTPMLKQSGQDRQLKKSTIAWIFQGPTNAALNAGQDDLSCKKRKLQSNSFLFFRSLKVGNVVSGS